MNGGIVEFDSLTDPDRSGAKDDDDGLFGAVFRDKSGSLVLLVSGGVEVGGFCRKLRSAGIDHLIGIRKVGESRVAGQACNRFIRKTVSL